MEFPVIVPDLLMNSVLKRKKWQLRRVIPVKPEVVKRIDGANYWIGNTCVGSPFQPDDHLLIRGSEIRLAITAVQVERLQKISRESAQAEGIEVWQVAPQDKFFRDYSIPSGWVTDARYSFRTLWRQIYGKICLWESDPFVWALSFKYIDPD